MNKLLLTLLLMSTLLACTISFDKEDDSFEDKAGTQVAVALTATALDQHLNDQDQNEEQASQDPTPIPTPTEDTISDAQINLGAPTYTDSCSTLSAWTIDPVDEIVEEGITTIRIDNGRLSMQSSQVGKFHWRLNYQEFADGYLQAKIETGSCSGSDQYGVIFRAPDYSDGVGYYFTMTCDGHYGLREKKVPYAHNDDSQMIIDMTFSDKINQGANQTNTIGVRTVSDSIKLYMNDHLIDELSGVSLTSPGHFGLYIYARQTPGFAILMDEISFWLLNN